MDLKNLQHGNGKMTNLYPIHDHSMSKEEVEHFLIEKGIFLLLNHQCKYLEKIANINNIPLKYIPQNNTFEIHPDYYKNKRNGSACND